MNVLDKIIKAHYVADEAQVEALARQHYTASTEASAAGSTYLRVLVAGVQAQLGPKRGRSRVDATAALSVLEAVHGRFYAAVLNGITTPEVAPDDSLDAKVTTARARERNRRSTFARSSKSTLATFIKGGGDLRVVTVATVTKRQLREAVAPPEPTDRVERRITRAQAVLVRAAKRMARDNVDNAQQMLADVIDALQGELDALGEEQPAHDETQAATTMVAHRSGPRSTSQQPAQYHRGA